MMPSENHLKSMSALFTPFFICAALLALSCKECPSEPENHDNSDTTSHNFVWEIDTLGNYGSYLKDAWIVNEDDIWVVGKIIMPDPDSSWNGTGRETFNAAHWNGSQWKLSRFERGAPLNSIWYFNENDIWASGGVPIHWNGDNWDFYHLWDMGVLDNDDGGVDNIWASSPNDIYFVGAYGSIVHYDGSGFEKIESGTGLPFQDVWGIHNHMKDSPSIIAVASDPYYNRGKKVVQLTQHTVQALPDSGLSWSLCGCWVSPDGTLYLAGAGVYTCDALSPYWSQIDSLPAIYSHAIRGQASNDILVAGSSGMLAHFNGVSWQEYFPWRFYGNYYSVAMKDNLAIAVGVYAQEGIAAGAVIARGTRIKTFN